VLPFRWDVFVTLRGPRDAGNNPRESHALEWATTSPPPPYNFEHVPPIRSERPFFDLRYGHGARGAITADSTAAERAHS
jgi:heme/copper-type cytochrome/quinol oxidase subunit 1